MVVDGGDVALHQGDHHPAPALVQVIELHVGDEGVDGALIASNAMRLAMDLFAQYPFNNLLHHQVLLKYRSQAIPLERER